MAKRTTERTDFLASVLVTAVEGGVNHWAAIKDYKWLEDADKNLTSAAVELNDGFGWKRVGLNMVASGIGKLKRGTVPIADGLKATLVLADKENDASDVDSELADCIVQAGLFGKLVYC